MACQKQLLDKAEEAYQQMKAEEDLHQFISRTRMQMDSSPLKKQMGYE